MKDGILRVSMLSPSRDACSSVELRLRNMPADTDRASMAKRTGEMLLELIQLAERGELFDGQTVELPR